MAGELHKEGLEFLLKLFNKQATAPAAHYYMGICEESSLAEDATLASVTEPSGGSYSRQEVDANGVDLAYSACGTNDAKLTVKTCTFTPSGGDWNLMKTKFLATTSDGSGKLIASAPINGGTGVTLTDGVSYSTGMEIELDG